MSYSRLPPEEFAELLRPHLPALYRLAFRLTGRQAQAEDLLQELLVRQYARSKRLTAVDSLLPWLARALYNLHIDQIRQQRRTPFGHLQQPSEDAADECSAHPNYDTDPDLAVEMDILRQGLAQAMAQLPEEQRLVVMLHDVEGYEMHEAAAILGVPLGTAKSRLHRAHERLREPLRRRNLIPSNFVLTDVPNGLSAAIESCAGAGDDD